MHCFVRTARRDLPPRALSIGKLAAALFLAVGTVLAPVSAAGAESGYGGERREMTDAIAALAELTSIETGRETFDERVMAAMSTVPRHRFVKGFPARLAYANRPLPIGHGQTISQPYIVALMSDLLDTKPGDVVLEVGTGSGYQAAILSLLTDKVFTIEIIEALGREAGDRLAALGYDNVAVRVGDGYYGWPDHAPFDAIIVTAAASHIPPPLIGQLKAGGRMVIPVGGRFQTQSLTLIEKGEDGVITSKSLLPVAFVPLTGGH